jgi:hypothetical protein
LLPQAFGLESSKEVVVRAAVDVLQTSHQLFGVKDHDCLRRILAPQAIPPGPPQRNLGVAKPNPNERG